jgi:hypothetical protein
MAKFNGTTCLYLGSSGGDLSFVFGVVEVDDDDWPGRLQTPFLSSQFEPEDLAPYVFVFEVFGGDFSVEDSSEPARPKNREPTTNAPKAA